MINCNPEEFLEALDISHEELHAIFSALSRSGSPIVLTYGVVAGGTASQNSMHRRSYVKRGQSYVF